MSELTDFEICREIARIQNLGFAINFDGSFSASEGGDSDPYPFNPLTDDALCFRLMKKYKVDINNDEDNNLCTAWYAEYKSIQNVDMNKAICLAIIEANKDKL